MVVMTGNWGQGKRDIDILRVCTKAIRKTPNLLFITFLYFFMLFSKKAEKVQKSPVLYFF